MASAAPATEGRLRQRLAGVYGLRLLLERRTQLLAIAIVASLAVAYRVVQFAVLSGAPQWGYDFSAYWLAGRHVLEGSPLYAPIQLSGAYPPQGQYLYLYPPLLAVLVTPLSAAFPDYRAAAWLWAILGLVILCAVVAAVARAEHVARRVLGGFPALLAATIVFPPVVGELVLGNVHLVLLGLLTVAWLAVRRADAPGDVVAGLAIGLAALIKLFPALLVLWLVLVGRRRPAAISLATMALLALATLPIVGLQPWLDYPRTLLNMAPLADARDALAPMVWLSALLPPVLARGIVLVAAIVLIAWAARHRSERASYAIAVSAAVLTAPALFHHYLAILVLPMLLALAEARRVGWLALPYLAMWGGQQPALGAAAWIVNRALPALGALSVPAGLVHFGRRPKE